MKHRIKPLCKYLDILIPLVALLFGILIMSIITSPIQQAATPVPMTQSFLGEYSYDKENWYPLEDPEILSAEKQDLYLRGHFSQDILPRARIYYYSNHIGNELYIDGALDYLDIVLELDKYGISLQPAMCARGWRYWYFEEGLPQESLVEIHLYNPHSYGNKTAYTEFINTLQCTADNPDFISQELSPYGAPYLTIGIIFVITSVMLLVSALISIVMHFPLGQTILKMGLLAGFAGAFFLLDTIGLSFWSESNILNTYGRQISMMYTVYMLGIMAKDIMNGKIRKTASFILYLSAIFNTGILIVSFSGMRVIYDTMFSWVCLQMVICPILIGCCAAELLTGDKEKRVTLSFLLILFVCVILDIIGFADSMYSKANLTKIVFIVYFVCVFFQFVRKVFLDHKASDRAKKLEKELEESRISIMLSQIQPHFMFNVLGTLRGLCREDPEQAWRGLGDFSAYLRGNMNALTNTKFIPFDAELRHVETYLRLEKMRLGEKLSIVYNIQETDFSIPPLTLQPLVENAVKHGIFYKMNGGTVIIHSRREAGNIVISVQDDGVGFDAVNPEPSFEKHEHVGLFNVRNRIEIMLGGKLEIDSEAGSGTTVTLVFPAPDRK